MTMTKSVKSYAIMLPWSIELPGGVNEVVRNLIQEFRLAGEFHPIFLEGHWPSAKPVVEKRKDYTHIRMRIRGLDNTNIRATVAFFLSLPATLWNLASFVKDHHIVAINIHFPFLDALNWIMLRKLGLFSGKVILSFHGSEIRKAHGLRGWARFVYRYLLRHADMVVSCSKDLQNEVLALEPRAKGAVIYNGIEEGRFHSETSPAMVPAELQDKELILNIGKYEYRKAHDLLLRAFRQVLEKWPTAHLVIVGATGPEIDKTKAVAFDSGLGEHVTFYHDLPHSAIPGMLDMAQVFVLSSRWVPGKMGEGFPVAILEAGVAGKPVVTTRTCGAAEIITDGVTGRLVPLEDEKALADAICEMLDNKEKARIMAQNLRRMVLTEYTWKRAYQSYVELCRSS